MVNNQLTTLFDEITIAKWKQNEQINVLPFPLKLFSLNTSLIMGIPSHYKNIKTPLN